MEEESHMNTEGILEEPFSLQEIAVVCKCLKNGKSGGIDGLVYEHIKFGGETLWTRLTNLFNAIREREYIPAGFKKGLLTTCMKNYKPSQVECVWEAYRDNGEPWSPGNGEPEISPGQFKLCLFGRRASMHNTILAKKVFLYRLYSYVLTSTKRKAGGLVSECFEVAREYGLEGWLEEYWLTTNFPAAREWKQLVKTTIRAKENEMWQATVSAESTCHRFYKVHPTSEKPHKLWVLARQQPEHQRDLKNLILISTVPTKHSRKPCPTCKSDTEDLVGHLFTRSLADDICLLASTRMGLQRMIDTMTQSGRKWRFEFAPEKNRDNGEPWCPGNGEPEISPGQFKLCLFGRRASMHNTILAKKVFLYRLYSYVLTSTKRKAGGLVSECFEVAREYGLEGWLEEYWLTTNFPAAREWKQLVKTTIRAKENEMWQATVSAESTCHRFYKVHPTSEKPHKLWVLARQQPEHQRDLKNLILISTVPTKHSRKPCPTCKSDTEDLVGHLFTRCTTFL
ncbi:hypothetical protein Bbelb_271830 [Branchiostoma belcheri]|nr:hypothetical protein Bbelb_271830 [Branchiostoma belcheri]